MEENKRLTLDDWLIGLNSNQKKEIETLVADYGNTEAAKIWYNKEVEKEKHQNVKYLSAEKGIMRCNRIMELNQRFDLLQKRTTFPTWEQIKAEFDKLLCKDLDDKLLKTNDTKAIIELVAKALITKSVLRDLSIAFISVPLAILLNMVFEAGRIVYCKCNYPMQEATM